MNVYEIPLSPVAQTLSISLGSVQYRLTVRWNRVLRAWVLDIADADNVSVLTGAPLVTGIDLLEQYAHLEFGGSLVVQSDLAGEAAPDYTSLGVTGHLYWVTP